MPTYKYDVLEFEDIAEHSLQVMKKCFRGLPLLVLLTGLTVSCNDDSASHQPRSMNSISFLTGTDQGRSFLTRGVPIYEDNDQHTVNNLETAYGEFKAFAYISGDVGNPLCQVGEDDQPDPNKPFAGISYTPVWENGFAKPYDDEYFSWQSSAASGFYWWENMKLRFFAYAPTTVWEGVTGDDFNNNGDITFGYTVPSTAVNEPDILVGSTDVLSRPAENEAVRITFYHPLCGVRFRLTGSTEQPFMPGITINSITLKNLVGSGTCTYTHGASGKSKNKISWSKLAQPTSTFSQSFGTTTTDAETPGENQIKDGQLVYGSDSTKVFMLIPQTFGENEDAPDAKIAINFTYGGSTADREATLTGFKSSATATPCWEPGVIYTYTIHLKPDLSFWVTVEPEDWWVNDNGDGDGDFDDDVILQ